MNDQAKASQITRFAMPAIAVALAAMLCLMMGTGTAWAGGGKDIATFKGKVVTTIVNKGDPEAYGDFKGGKKVTSVRSSNKKVATVKIVDCKSYNYILITKKKAGTTKITYKLAGKTKTVTFKVCKWQNPVKTLKIGSKNYASKFKKSASAGTTIDLGGKTVKVKAASGWKVQKILAITDTGSVKTVKNFKKLPTTTYFVQVKLKNKNTKAVETVSVYGY